jgi:hypothetical protein
MDQPPSRAVRHRDAPPNGRDLEARKARSLIPWSISILHGRDQLMYHSGGDGRFQQAPARYPKKPPSFFDR